ncbi:thioredoxin family protein [Arcobacter porcinus]|uniref:thioredoxin family protein n=1 Tax=Arcobacter porcinus TaxID=1935204 RepID=UPI00081EB62C|nr:thioredoxin fold domain-containing protein [Arcobacter porcinus]OCL84682.1 thiol:disulfide interchange protein precursor [Arcobacter porcinus]
MNIIFKKVIMTSLLLSSLFTINLFAQEGKVIGSSDHTAPSWFKQSFLDIAEDVSEASEEGKHFMIFFDFEGCPYCSKMLKESFEDKNKTSDFVKKYFDVIELNVKGSKEVTWVDGDVVSERDLTNKLKIQYSPTMVFFDEDKNIIARVNGYRNSKDFKDILDFVQTKSYLKMDLLTYLNNIEKKEIYKFKSNKMFKELTDLSKIKTPLAIIFEDSSCIPCDHFHEKILTNKEVQDEFSKYTIVRLDANSNSTIITPNGEKTSAKAWVEKIKLDYRPGILLYNDGELKSTIDALLFPFHFKEVLRYVSGKFYITYPNTYLDYLKDRQEELIKSGVDINVAE